MQCLHLLASSDAGLSVYRIMDEIGCTRRSVYRYLDTLLQAGFPIVSTRESNEHTLYSIRKSRAVQRMAETEPLSP